MALNLISLINFTLIPTVTNEVPLNFHFHAVLERTFKNDRSLERDFLSHRNFKRLERTVIINFKRTDNVLFDKILSQKTNQISI